MSGDPLAWIADELESLDRQGLRRRLVRREGPQRARVRIEGRDFLNFSSNDYLGLAAELAGSVGDALQAAGWGSGASPLVTGRGALHARLEEELAGFEGTEAALLFNSGYAANVGAITALCGPGDVIFSDARNHASIIDGCRLSGATVRVYRHADAGHLSELLETSPGFRRRLIVTDGLFSMDGDLAPLPDLAELARRHQALLMVDEAHATGVFGAEGRGVHEHLGLDTEVHVRVGTLSKALGSIGGFVAGSELLIQWLANRARTYVFSTALPEATCAAALEALRRVRQAPEIRLALLHKSRQLRERLELLGWNTGRSSSQIIPLIVGQPEATMSLAAKLREAGLLVPGIRPPSVPAGESLLRVSVTAAHDDQMLARLVSQLGVWPRPG